jgi:hypothetical protein
VDRLQDIATAMYSRGYASLYAPRPRPLGHVAMSDGCAVLVRKDRFVSYSSCRFSPCVPYACLTHAQTHISLVSLVSVFLLVSSLSVCGVLKPLLVGVFSDSSNSLLRFRILEHRTISLDDVADPSFLLT